MAATASKRFEEPCSPANTASRHGIESRPRRGEARRRSSALDQSFGSLRFDGRAARRARAPLRRERGARMGAPAGRSSTPARSRSWCSPRSASSASAACRRSRCRPNGNVALGWVGLGALAVVGFALREIAARERLRPQDRRRLRGANRGLRVHRTLAARLGSSVATFIGDAMSLAVVSAVLAATVDPLLGFGVPLAVAYADSGDRVARLRSAGFRGAPARRRRWLRLSLGRARGGA